MNKKKIIALTSILTFSLFIFSPNVFAEDTLTNQNIINKKTSDNTTGSENKVNQENKTATNETKNDKIDNSQNNNIKKENTENKSDTNKINNEVDNNIKKENTEDKKVESEVKSVEPKDTVDNDIKDANDVKNRDGYTYDSGTHEVKYNNIDKARYKSYLFVQQQPQSANNLSSTVNDNTIVNIPDPKFKACLNRNIYYTKKGVDTSHDNENITIGQLKKLNSIQLMNITNITNLTGIEYCTNLEYLQLQNQNISNINGLSKCKYLKLINLSNNNIKDLNQLNDLTNLRTLWIESNGISDISQLKNLTNLQYVSLSYNNISDISQLETLTNLKDVNLNNNKIHDISPLDNFKSSNFKINIKNQKNISLNKATIDDGSGEINNPVTFPNTYSKNFNLSITPNGDIKAIQEKNKISLSNLNNTTTSFNINDSVTLTKNGIIAIYSTTLELPVEHVSTIKVDLPTSMTFDVVTNTIDPKTGRLKPTFATADYTIKNRGKKPVTIIPSYSVTEQGGVDLVENISDSDISKNNDVKIAVKLKNLSTNQDIMSVINNSTGTQFTVGAESNTQLRFEPGTNGMADVEKEQLSDTKSTLGKITFTITN
ncbi:leucine-rich repeat domain-containing protein [Clostridium perfringens]|nr:leucine-rich repeat domain-containing protein [Clostridium perfringens]